MTDPLDVHAEAMRGALADASDTPNEPVLARAPGGLEDLGRVGPFRLYAQQGHRSFVRLTMRESGCEASLTVKRAHFRELASLFDALATREGR